MKILIDMNMSPSWAHFLRAAGHDALHWSEVGSPCASDREIMSFAANRGMIVLTQDLDFGALLAASPVVGPSVIQIRAARVSPTTLGDRLNSIIAQHAGDLSSGALVTVDMTRARSTILPLERRSSG